MRNVCESIRSQCEYCLFGLVSYVLRVFRGFLLLSFFVCEVCEIFSSIYVGGVA